MPTVPSQTQLANRLNPTPFNAPTTNRGLFRGVGDRGDQIYYDPGEGNGNVYSIGLGSLQTPGTSYGDALSSRTGNLKSQYGIDFSSLPEVNIGDYIQGQTKAHPGQWGTSGFSFQQGNFGMLPQVPQNASLGGISMNDQPQTLASPDMYKTADLLREAQLQDVQGMNHTAIPDVNPNQAFQGNMQMPTPGSPSMTSTPTVPTNVGTPGTNGGGMTTPGTSGNMGTPMIPGTNTADTSTATDNELLKSILDSMKPSGAENDLQSQLNNLQASRRLSFQNMENQPIATSFITGQENAINKRVGDEASTLQAELATKQAQRLAAVDANKFALSYSQDKQKAAAEANKPMEVSAGASLYSPSGSLLGTAPSAQSASGGSSSTTGNKLTEVSPGASLYDPILGKSVYTAPTSASQTAAAKNSSSASSGTRSGSLDVGSSGSSVQALQQFLVSKGFLSAADMATGPGTYGPKTQAAVAKFQQAAGVDTSGGGVGTFGPRTQAAAQQQGFTGGGSSSTSRPDPKSNYTASSIPANIQKDLIADMNKQGVTLAQLYENYPDVSTSYLSSLYNSLHPKSGSSIEDQINSLF